MKISGLHSEITRANTDVIYINTTKPILEFTITAILVRTLKNEKPGTLDVRKKMEGNSVGELG